MQRMGVAAMVAAAVVAVASCSESGRPCFAGDYRVCACSAASTGFQLCSATEDGYEPCVCDGHTPGVDGSAPDADADAACAPPQHAFLADCETDAQCETGFCFAFNAKGLKCTKRCTSPSDCPAPSTGCNKQGICKAP